MVLLGRVVIDRKSDQTSCSALSDAEPHLWGSNRLPLVLPPSWEGWLTGRAMGLDVTFVMACLSVRPRTSLLFFGLLAQTVAVSFVGSSLPHCELCRLVVVVVVVDIAIVVHLLFTECWERSLSEETRKFLGPTPPRFVVTTPLREPASSYPGRRNGSTLPHRETKVSGAGSS